MVPFLLFVGGGLFLFLIIWLSQTSDRTKKLEKQIGSLRDQLAGLRAKEIERETADAEAESTAKAEGEETPPTTEAIQRSQFTAAKERAVQPEESKSPQVVSPEPEDTPVPAGTEAAEEKTGPPPIPKPSTETKPKPVSPPPAKAPEPEKPLIEWRPILEKLNLIPPTGKNAEAAILSWWLPRAGVVALIIAAVFAGIYFSHEVPPWLWILGLSGISAAVTLLGAWLERRVEAFGRLVSTAGLAMGYFTAFAAFALPATKVIDDPVFGVLVQVLALAIMIGWSLWKNDRSVAAMALLLGYVSVGFSHHHDLDNTVIAGLLLLAAGGGVLLVLRRWLWPHAIATAGSWGGFFILAIGKWSASGDAPEFPLMLGSLLLLTAILEAANFLAEERGSGSADSKPRERKWLSVINTSAAIAVSWIAVRQVHPGQEEIFFLAFAILMFAITALRFWRKHPVGLTETFFLKTVALLALYFVEKFSGPTRWLSLAIEAGLVLWAFRRSGFRMVEIGFGAVFLGALGFIWNDVMANQLSDGWQLFGIPSLMGAATLVLLSVELGLHSLWSPGKPGGKENFGNDPVKVFGLIAAAFTGFAAAAFAFSLASENKEIWQPLYLSLVALALAAPAIVLRRFPPIAAGIAAIVPAYLGFLEFPSGPAGDGGGTIFTAIWLILLGFGLAEAAFRFWLDRWHCGNVVRALFYGLGFLTLGDLIYRLEARFEYGPAAQVFWVALFAAAGAGIVIGLSRRFDWRESSGVKGTHDVCQWLIALFLGVFTLILTLHLLEKHDYLSVWLGLAGAILFAAAFGSKNSVPAAAGGLPFFVAIGFYAVFGFESGDSDFGTLLLCALALVVVSLGTSLVLWRFANREKFPEVNVFEAILQAAALFVIHWVFRTQLEVSEVFFADALLAAGAAVAGRKTPLRALLYLSSLPLALALLHAGVSSFESGWGGQIFWWLAAAASFGWIWLLYSRLAEEDRILSKIPLQIWNGAIATGVITVAGFHALDNPWHLAALTGFSLILTGLWRWEKIPGLHFWALVPLAVAGFGAVLRIGGAVETDDIPGLIAVSLTAAGIIGHGVLIAFRKPAYRLATWVHALTALGLVFLAYSPGTLGVSELTTVCWGVAAILVFAAGFVAGLRPLRLSGLIGLGLCIIRMFVIDIDDDLYRIYAALIIAVVLLVMGYAYHRFRPLIERADHREPDSD